MDRIQFNPKLGVSKIRSCKNVFLVCTVFSGGRWIMGGGGCPYIYIYTYAHRFRVFRFWRGVAE